MKILLSYSPAFPQPCLPQVLFPSVFDLSVLSLSIAHSLADKGRREGCHRTTGESFQARVRTFPRCLGPLYQTPEPVGGEGQGNARGRCGRLL